MLQLLQTWETKFFIKWPFSGNKKLFTSKEVKEFPKMCQKSNSRSVRDKNHRKSNYAGINAQETHRPHDLSISKDTICSVKNKNPPQHILHPYFKGSSFRWSNTLFMLTSDGSGRLTVCGIYKMHYCLMTALMLYSQFPVIKKEI